MQGIFRPTQRAEVDRLLDPARPQAGLGTSLLADQPTLVERLGLEEVNGTLKVDVRLAQFLWADSEAPQP
jgi:hypothetical protein